MIRVIKKNYSFLFSVVSHAVIICLFATNWLHRSQEVNVGAAQLSIPAYIYHHSQKDSSSIKHEQAMTATSLTHQMSVAKNASSQTTQDALSSRAKNATISGDGEKIPELIALLHAAIQSHQHYPDSALQMEREGKTKVMFVLYPGGTINHLKIINSSGTTTLDQAALAAIKDSVPFKGVSRFLTKPEEYQITVSFELT